jgi:uncharacterized lipoprotein YajG
MWLMFLLAAKFLYASITRPSEVLTISPPSTDDSMAGLEHAETARRSKWLKQKEMVYFELL